jgi:threonine/homoserine/homoserine lactone efflux protein
MMITALLYGLFVGFMLCLTLGTVFFSLIQNSIDYGFKTGIYIATGVVISDSILISFAILGIDHLPNIPHLKTYASMVCALLVFVMGISSILKKQKPVTYPSSRLGGFFYFASTGFLLNVLNPVNFIVWAALSARLTTENHYNLKSQIFFFVGALISIFTTEIGISFSASKLKTVFTEKNLQWINRITGAIFIIISLKIVFDLISIQA